jgi:hypothetical protein
MFKFLGAAVVGLALCVVPVSALAVTSSYIDGVTGVWSSTTPTGPMVKLSPDGSRISWGRPVSGTRKSGYAFDEIVDRGPHDLGQTFDLGQFTHNNFAITGPALTAARLAVTITGRLVDGALSQDFTLTSVFDIIHDETANRQKKCPYGDRPPCGDLITFLTNTALSETITFNGVSYLFETTGFLGGFRDGFSLFSDEARKNSAILQGRLTGRPVDPPPPPPPSPVPLPAGLPLLLAGLAAAGFVSRRRAG